MIKKLPSLIFLMLPFMVFYGIYHTFLWISLMHSQRGFWIILREGVGLGALIGLGTWVILWLFHQYQIKDLPGDYGPDCEMEMIIQLTLAQVWEQVPGYLTGLEVLELDPINKQVKAQCLYKWGGEDINLKLTAIDEQTTQIKIRSRSKAILVIPDLGRNLRNLYKIRENLTRHIAADRVQVSAVRKNV